MPRDESFPHPAGSAEVLEHLEVILRRARTLGARRNRELAVTIDPDQPPRPLEDGVAAAVAQLSACVRECYRYTISGLGTQGSSGRVRWARLSYGVPRRVVNFVVSLTCSLLPASRFKNALYRMIGFRIGRDAEISLSAFLDPFCPPLVSIGDRTVVGAFAKIFSHAYKGGGEVIVGEVTIGDDCRILGEALIGPCRIGDRSVVMLQTPTIPYFDSVPPDHIVGYTRPEVRRRGDRDR